MKSKRVLLAFACALAASTGQSQDHLGGYRPLTLAPADANSSGGGGAVDDEKVREAELVKETLNPIASLTSVPFQNNWDSASAPPTP